MALDEKRVQKEHFITIQGDRYGYSKEPGLSDAPADLASWIQHPATPIVSYCGSSIMMTVLNKYVLSVDFNLNFFLVCAQGALCILFIQTLKAMDIITYRDFNMNEARKWFPISLLLVSMIYTCSKAIQYLSIPVYTIFKNLTIILTAYVVLSSVIAAWSDIQVALTSTRHLSDSTSATPLHLVNAGYTWMFVNCLCSSAYVLGMRKRIKLTNFKDFDTMFYNNLLSIPILIAASILTEDWSMANINRNFPPESRNQIVLAIILTGVGAACISYTSAWCVRVTSGATYSMVGALNKIPVALSGFVFFHTPVTGSGVLAIIVGSLSGIVFGIAKQRK